MTINVNTLVRAIENAAKQSKSPLEILEYSKAISQLNLGTIITVSAFSNLPDIRTVSGGALYYVITDKQLYIPNIQLRLWVPLSTDPHAVVSWGTGFYGKMGDNTIVNKSSPVSVVGGFTDWCQISSGWNHSSAVRTNGTLWTWGKNYFGQLGDNTTVNKSSPVSVVGGFTDWCQVSAGFTHTAAVRTNGTLWAWGRNYSCQLGNNSFNDMSSPVSVVGGFTDWCQVSAGSDHTAAVRTNGTLWAWGCNYNGQLGSNNSFTTGSPVSAAGGFTDWCQVSAGAFTTAAVRTNGTLWTWGCNSYGQLGHGTATTCSRSSPVSVIGGFTNWCQVNVGKAHMAAVRTNGTLWTWGVNACGQLGDNTSANKSSPVSVVGGFADWCQVSAGTAHTVAIRTNGTLWTWGYNGSGELGNNSTIRKSSPVSVVGNLTDWWESSAGSGSTIAIRGRKLT